MTRTQATTSACGETARPLDRHRLRRGTIFVAIALLVAWVTTVGGTAGSASAGGQARSPVGRTPVSAPASHPGRPDLGPNVYVFGPAMSQSEIQTTVDSIAAQQVPNQFGTQRYALFFEPGTYGSAADPLIFQVGYYTQVAGLGGAPGDVVINGSIDVYNQCEAADNCTALDNFWRSMSNLTVNVTGQSGCRAGADFWAVSQAAPMRRVNITGGNLSLMDYCSAGPQYASGGFIADSAFSGGTVINGSQQQFVVRNSNLDGWSNGVWNQVFAGDVGAPPQSFSANSGLPGGSAPYTTLATSPVTEAEPFLSVDARGGYTVSVPSVMHDSAGPAATAATTIPIRRFFVAGPDTPVARINLALALGQNLLLTPGVYDVKQTIEVTRPGTVVLGLGFATLIPERGIVAMRVADVPGVKLSGMIFDAGPVSSPELLQVGTCAHGPYCRPGHGGNPTLIQDVFFRIGGAEPGRATDSLVVNSSNVILDDIWAWRADHGNGVGWTGNVADTGVTVNGDNVTAYGLFVEHYQKSQVVWNGQHGTDIFFQNEMPYDPPDQASWMANPTTDGYPAFLVSPKVTSFQGYGMGSYCFFNQGVPIHSATAFVVPDAPGVQLHDLLTRFLNASGGIDHVVNTTGAPVTKNQPGPSDVVGYP